jgi:catechol 2,3-dioxygenase-like lactoylglutathione lyase family enzyme
MPVLALDHVNLRTRDPERTRAFFRDVLGMTIGPPPGEAGHSSWVYDDSGIPIIHTGAHDSPYPSDARHPYTPANGSGSIHHVALRCADFEGMRARLAAHGLDYSEADYPSFGLRQLFVTDPDGVMLELNFPY